MIKSIRTTERNTLMLHELEYPFDSEYILKKSKSLKRRLLEENTQRIPKKIAVLGGSTTHDIIRILELFLLNQGIEPTFYESEYGMYWEDAMFGNEELNAFGPDLVYIHTSFRNLRSLPEVKDSREQVEDKLRSEFEHFQVMWEKLADTWHCPIIQDNFELPYYRLMGNQDGADFHGRTWYVNRMNQMFADDNPAEREIVRQQAPGVTAPEIGKPEDYIRVLDRGGYFEVTSLSEDDRKRNEMYQANLKREKAQASFADYAEYLKSLDMKATIRSFEPVYMARIAQLTNKSNQFNLTTQRMTQAQIEQMAADDSYITLYGKLEDKFGDNGVVSVVIAQKEEKAAHIRLWLMSCRVLKRDMELAMLDELVERCQEAGIEEIYGYYYPTAKNNMVRKFYGELGFEKCSEDETGNSVWKLNTAGYEKRNHVIEVES